IDVVHLKSLKRDFEEIEITPEDERRILELSTRPDIEKILTSSVAPSIYGYEEIKKAIALQLFGGTRGKLIKGNVPVRDDIHILLIGDPGISKTQFLQQSTRLAPKSIYVSGKSVTSAGLTISAEKDELGDGGWTLKAGALVLASGGNVSIDEFDKISEEDRSSLHEVLESQTVSVAKAGIVSKFKAKTSVLAAANPKYGRFDQNRNIAEQFDIPPTLLSRFDLIFPIFDILDEEKDSKLADHILTSHLYASRGEKQEEKEETITLELLRKYISYARRNVRPILTKEAMSKIREYYIDLRKLGMSSGSVAITPRYLEGMVRLSEANAKMRLSPIVEESDAESGIFLMRYVLSKIMTDKETGRIDVDIVATGRSRTQVERLQKVDTIKEIIRELSKQYDSVDIDMVIEEASSKYDIDDKTSKRIIFELLRKGELYEKEHGHVRLVDDR
ncbi:MAG: minichromosome maintenance protein MCM, partial [Candidatus ainarchaeum sp.]|nr:minichromosome maintenance protein MCM [Candidatus ainarchaeum sp.]